MYNIFLLLESVHRELLLFSAIWLLIGALDDFSVDAIWTGRWLYRRVAFYRDTPPMTASQLPKSGSDGLLAIFIPAWGEAAVIGAMLGNCTRSWAATTCSYRIYVGCYPNDHQSVAAVAAAARHNPRIRVVLVGHDGPTTKADCLNRLWRALLADEVAGGYKAKAIIMHDAEDAVHADELHVFNRLVTKGGAVQLPVIPVRTHGSRWISGHYCDEFAEAHGKNMVVREALGAPLPLAGVACAIERNLMGRLAVMNGGKPFDQSSLTEDYELGIRIGAAGGRTIMARLLDDRGKLVGTRACFPDTLSTSVRQKTRWLTGIALAGWDRLGWEGGLAQKWMFLQDRRSILAAIVLMAAYMCIILTGVLLVAASQGLYQPSPFDSILAYLLWFNAAFLFWRLLVRAGFVGALYGPKEALLSVPRSLIANIIAIMAARRACVAYIRHCFGAPLSWDKTAHHTVPEALVGRD
nr:glycosyl transferase family protein [uncultured Sphingorhabdus sp.]